MIIKVTTIELATGKVSDERTANIKTVKGQTWLINHMNWAFTNKHGIQLHNVNDNPPE